MEERGPEGADEMLTEMELARRLKLSPGWLRNRRSAGNGPPYYKVGGAVRYDWRAVLAWIGPPKAGKDGSQ